MNQLNSLIIEGNAVRKADFSEPKTGFYVCRFPVAVNRWYKNKNNEGVSEVSFFDVEAYGKVAETCNKKIDRGTGLRIVGRLKQDRWKDKDGKTQSKCYVIAEHIEYKPKFNEAPAPAQEADGAETEAAAVTAATEEAEETVF
jgi:single-strand DNA-binding protein